MTVTQRARGRVPLEQRSVIVTVAGVPWWGALACASIAIVVGYLIDSVAGTELTMFFSVMFFFGCVAAVLVVQNKSLFTALVQPPLLLIISVPLAYKSFAAGPTQGLKSLVLDMALPLIDRFPTMAFTSIVVWAIGAFRLTLYVQERRANQSGGRRRSANPTENPGGRATAASPPRPGRSQSKPDTVFEPSPAGARASSPRPRPAVPAVDVPASAAATPGPRASRPAPRSSVGSPQAPVDQPRAGRRASGAQPVGETPRTASPRAHRYAEESPQPGRRRREDQPRKPAPARRPLPDLDEPSTGRRRLQQESVREFAERKGDAPRYRPERQERPSPESPDRPRPAVSDPPAKPNVPRLPNVRYRD